MDKKIKVLVIDDSALMRKLLSEILASDPQIEVVGTASDAYIARDKIKTLNPDVLTLDVEMPRMDGLSFLRNLMRLRPMPVVMCSTLTQAGAETALDALALGAVDVVGKPTADAAHGIKHSAQEIIAKVKMAASVKVRASGERASGERTSAERRPQVVEASRDAGAVLAKRPMAKVSSSTDHIIAIGASTGGTEAIKELLTQLSPDIPGVVIAQHIPKAFSGPFSARMNACSALTVCEARDGDAILAGHVYIAPGDEHLVVERAGRGFRCRLDPGPLVNRHRPSVDVLFRSVAQTAGHHAVGVLLTGMGRDGAEGLKEMLEAGAATIAQDEQSSVVWGMPGAAWKIGAAQALHPLSEIAGQIMTLCKRTNASQTKAQETGLFADNSQVNGVP
jgi:two-component system, chemotaxis family, protein-glutamate methylesterase/glutaminase